MTDAEALRVFDELTTTIYTTRMPARTREVALAMAWVAYRHPQRPTIDSTEFWDVMEQALGRDRVGQSRLSELLAKDAPGYRPPRSVDSHSGECEGPRMRPYRPRDANTDPDCTVYLPAGYKPPPPRNDRVCGANATIQVIEHNMVTGWQRAHWFCRRHSDRADQVRAQIQAMGEPPEPIPNVGGVLPCLFPEIDWEPVYVRHSRYWRRPYHGLRRDGWPTSDTRNVPRRPRLGLIVSASRDAS